MAWLPLHNELEKALAEEWLSYLDEGGLLGGTAYRETFGAFSNASSGALFYSALARLCTGAFRVFTLSQMDAWRERGLLFADDLLKMPRETASNLSIADLSAVQRAFQSAWTVSGEPVWRSAALRQADALRDRLRGMAPQPTEGNLEPRANLLGAACQLAKTASACGDEDLLSWLRQVVQDHLPDAEALFSRAGLSDGMPDEATVRRIYHTSRMLRTLIELDGCIPELDIAARLPELYKIFREQTDHPPHAAAQRQCRKNVSFAAAWITAWLEATVCHAAMIERFPAAARPAWMGLRDLWWYWRDPDTWWLIPPAARHKRPLPPDVALTVSQLYEGLPVYLQGMRHCTQPLFE
ncbi:MAG TPA: hypothetical protein PLO53_02800 [Candidatus Hydrogenedentes bacterium]|nr:hypothetical protein [Candidatus Hydrogenedentota bacterium]